MKDDVGECVSVWLRQFTDGLVQFTAALQLIMSLCTVHTLQCTHTVHAVQCTHTYTQYMQYTAHAVCSTVKVHAVQCTHSTFSTVSK